MALEFSDSMHRFEEEIVSLAMLAICKRTAVKAIEVLGEPELVIACSSDDAISDPCIAIFARGRHLSGMLARELWGVAHVYRSEEGRSATIQTAHRLDIVHGLQSRSSTRGKASEETQMPLELLARTLEKIQTKATS